MERHQEAVAKIAAAVKRFFDRKEPYRIFHGSTNSTRPLRYDRVVDISALSHVLDVNTARRTALVEPNVPMDKLVESTLKHGLVPPVVMEFPGITTGGGYAGTAGESSSFKHGFFDETINSVEMVLATGEVVNASMNERTDLFRGAAGAVGTLGITTLIELRLVEAKRYVRTTYRRARSVAEAVHVVKDETEKPENDFVDGILFSKEHAVVITGTLTNEKPVDTRPQTFSAAWDPWFYLHVRDKTSKETALTTDYIPLPEYLFRYDRGGFWVAKAAFDYFSFVPFNRLTRWFLDDLLHTRMLYRALHGSGESARFIVQDLALPYRTVEQFIDYAAENFNIWPLWLCPLKQTLPPTFHPHTGEAEYSTMADGKQTAAPKPMLNVGLWGWGPADPQLFVAKNRDLETKLRGLGGMKWLYAHTYYPEDEFWRAYDKNSYEALREKYAATTLPTVYEKVKVDPGARTAETKGFRQKLRSRWPFSGLYGVWKSIQSKDYFLHRNATWKYRKGHDEIKT
jgi:Delta24-sterol reductase